MPSFRVSVVVVCHNDGQWLSRCLESLRTQTTQGFEVIVVDNASTDGTWETVKRLTVQPRFMSYQTGADKGYAAACNIGAGLATGEFLCFLNADMWLEPDCLSHLCWGGIYHDAVTGITFNYNDHQLQATSSAGMDVFGNPCAAVEDTHIGQVFCTANVIFVKRETFIAVGGYDERLYMYGEELDLCWRLNAAGRTVGAWPTARVHHGNGSANAVTTDGKRFLANRNRLVTIAKNAQHVLLLLLLPCLLLTLLEGLAVWVVTRKWSSARRASLDAIRAAWAMRKHIRLKRLDISLYRQRSDWRLLSYLHLNFGRWHEVKKIFRGLKFKRDGTRVLALSSTAKDRNGIAEYTRQLYRHCAQDVQIQNLSPWTVLAAPFRGRDVIHVQHEFFMFDRLVGVTAIPAYVWLWLWRWIGYHVVTTVHSTYNTANLQATLPHFQRLSWLFGIGALYLRLHLKLVAACSDRVIVLSRMGLVNLSGVVPQEKLRYIPLGIYDLTEEPMLDRMGVAASERVFTMFGFAFPNKGFETGIRAMSKLKARGVNSARLVVVSGETAKSSFPGGGSKSYLSVLRELARELGLGDRVLFTGYVPSGPVLDGVFARTDCFVFPYHKRDFPSGAVSTAMATGKPIIVSDIEAFAEYDDLMRFRQGNSEDLADCMQSMLNADVAAQAKAVTAMNQERRSMRRSLDAHWQLYCEPCPGRAKV